MELEGSGRGGCTQGVEQIVSFYYFLQPQFFRPSASTDLDKVDDGSRHDIRCMLLHIWGEGLYEIK